MSLEQDTKRYVGDNFWRNLIMKVQNIAPITIPPANSLAVLHSRSRADFEISRIALPYEKH